MSHYAFNDSERSHLIGKCVQRIVDLDDTSLRGFLQFLGRKNDQRMPNGLWFVDFAVLSNAQRPPMPEKGGNNKIAVSVVEAAKLIGLGQATAWKLAVRGELPSVKIGGRRVVPVDKLREWINARDHGCR